MEKRSQWPEDKTLGNTSVNRAGHTSTPKCDSEVTVYEKEREEMPWGASVSATSHTVTRASKSQNLKMSRAFGLKIFQSIFVILHIYVVSDRMSKRIKFYSNSGCCLFCFLKGQRS